MEIKTTYRKLKEFDTIATGYYIRKGFYDEKTKQFTEQKPTKLVANLKSIGKQCKKLFEEFSEKEMEINIDCCSVDEKTKVILKDEKGNFEFTKEGQKERTKKIKALWEEEVTIHDRITKGTPDDFWLTEEEAECFSEIVIEKVESPKEEE